MFQRLPNDLLEIISQNIDIKTRRNFILINTTCYLTYYKMLQTKLLNILNQSNGYQYLNLLDCIVNDAVIGYAILKDSECKRIILEKLKRSDDEPSWIISLPECQPELITFILADKDYRDSLTQDEFDYLIRNYPELNTFVQKYQIPSPINKAIYVNNFCI